MGKGLKHLEATDRDANMEEMSTSSEERQSSRPPSGVPSWRPQSAPNARSGTKRHTDLIQRGEVVLRRRR